MRAILAVLLLCLADAALARPGPQWATSRRGGVMIYTREECRRDRWRAFAMTAVVIAFSFAPVLLGPAFGPPLCMLLLYGGVGRLAYLRHNGII